MSTPSLSAILLVDDDPTTNFINTRMLQRMQVSREILVALNGQEALAVLQNRCPPGCDTTCPTLVLLDVNMPVMNGFEFLEAFVRLPMAQHQNIVIVLLTTSQLDEDLVRVQQLPVTDFLQKPLTREDVAEILARHFNFPTKFSQSAT